MPTLHIPNAYLLYQTEAQATRASDLLNIQFYCQRFMWLIEAGDIIILPLQPERFFYEYIANIKNITSDDFTIISWHTIANNLTTALSKKQLLEQLKKRVTPHWQLQTCFYNDAIQAMIQYLNLKDYLPLVANRSLLKLDSKIWFRQFAREYNIPIAQGQVCTSQSMFTTAINKYLDVTGQLIIKKPHGASGKGNLGLSGFSNCIFQGTAKTIICRKINKKLINHIWQTMRDALNAALIVEVYLPHQNVFTIQMLTEDNSYRAFPCAKIRMADTWYGVCLSGHGLDLRTNQLLLQQAQKFAHYLTNKTYRGFFCCDAIQRPSGELLLTEVNMRPGAETPAYILAQHLFGHDYPNKRVLVTRRNLRINSWQSLMTFIDNNHWSVAANKNAMVIVLGICQSLRLAECLFIGPNSDSVQQMENLFLDTL